MQKLSNLLDVHCHLAPYSIKSVKCGKQKRRIIIVMTLKLYYSHVYWV